MTFIGKLILYALMMTFVITGAHAHELHEGSGVVCDQASEIEAYAANPAGIEQINVGKVRCAFVTVRYITGREVGRTRIHGAPAAIVEILVVAVQFGPAWGSITPEVQYTLFAIEETPA